MSRLGTPIGILRTGTILSKNNNGTVNVSFNQAGQQIKIVSSIPSGWLGPNGEFIGGDPIPGTSVILAEVDVAGNWKIVSQEPSNNIFRNAELNSTTVYQDQMSALIDGRALIQVKNGVRVVLDPNDGIEIGGSDTFLKVNPSDNIISYNIQQSLEFTESSRKISGSIKRDLDQNSVRDLLGSVLDSHQYDDFLKTIGMDPSLSTSYTSKFIKIRNPALAETRELFYEFSHSYNFNNIQEEIDRYSNSRSDTVIPVSDRTDNRTEAANLNWIRPNHLIESVKGTLVDTFGNILDINRVPLLIGKLDNLSLKNSTDKADAFKRILNEMRKSISFHFEINAKKGTEDYNNIVDVDNNLFDNFDYSRNESKFSIDIDKEGQFKINIPASSNSGNVPLCTRAANFASIVAKQDPSISANEFLRSETYQELFVKNFSSGSVISLNSSDDLLDGYASPHSFIDDQVIKYGTTYHDITNVCNSFLKSAGYLSVGQKLINFDEDHHLNTDFKPLEKIISDTIIISGPKANAGGRSGNINADGFISFNIGANTIDRQSLWLDTAGSIISRVGRDKNGISYASSLDGDMFIEIGGSGLGNTLDSRFSKENDAFRNGTLDIRVLINGQYMIFRMGPTGIDIVSPGTITLSSQQDMIFKSNSSMKFEAENIVMYAETSKRILNRHPYGRTIG